MLNHLNLCVSVVLILLVSFSFSRAEAVQKSSETKGMLVAFDATLSTGKAHKGLTYLADLGCQVTHKGKIDRRKKQVMIADQDISQVSHVALLRCETSVLESETIRETLLAYFHEDGNGFVVEGDFVHDQVNDGSSETLLQRGYVIKISYFNNLFSDRASKEDEIDGLALDRANGWVRQSKIYTHRAVGVPTPDAVGVLYFASTKNRSEFREQHLDIVQEIGQFNARHLREFEYLYVSSMISGEE